MSTIPITESTTNEYTCRTRKGFVIYKKIKGVRKFFTFCKWEEEHLHFYIEGYCDYYEWTPIRWIE